MVSIERPPVILIAEDDPDDQLMLRDAFEETCEHCQLEFVSDGVELMERLHNPAGTASPSLPDLLLLDLNMPLKDGRQSLVELRAEDRFQALPAVILTTSKNDEDRAFCLAQGANDYIVKPSRYTELLDIVKSLETWWAEK
jgi:CheY-like chemotaxis protein